MARPPDQQQQAPAAGSVPRFSSFKPKAQASSEPKEAPEPPTSLKSKGSREHHHRERKHHSSHRSERVTPTWREPPAADTQFTKDSRAGLAALREKNFTVDRDGDHQNLTYGSLHRSSVPSFARSGKGSVLGAPILGRIDRDESTEKQVVIATEGSNPRWRRKRNFWMSGGGYRDELSVRPTSKASQDELDADFLALDPRKRRRIASDSSDSAGSEDICPSKHAYRRLDTANIGLKEDKDNDRDVSPGLERTAESEVRRRGIALSRLVEKEPQNGQAWLDLIDHQDVEQADRRLRAELTTDERSSLAEIKLSIALKALKRVTDPHIREELLMQMMDESNHTTLKSGLRKKWDQILKENAAMVRLWIPYINFVQTEHMSFRFDDLRDTFTSCLQKVKEVRSKEASAETTPVEVYLVLRMTICLREAGYLEQAVAIWQANLEFNFSRPPSLKDEAPYHRLLESFEAFWESETPRIGDTGAKGWSAFSPSDEDNAPEAEAVGQNITDGKRFGLKSWYAEEKIKTAQSRMPARSLEDDGSDPYRVVLFSDIKEYILDIGYFARDLLVDAFLVFCELPPLPSAREDIHAWFKDPFLQSFGLFEATNTEHPESLQEEPRSGHFADVDDSQNTQSALIGFRKPFFSISSDTLFADSFTWFSPFSFREYDGAEKRSSVQITWVRQTLRTLVDYGICGDGLAEFLLAFELRYFPALVRKTAKALLKRRSSSLRLYNAYALVEYRLRNSATADNVLSTAIGMDSLQSDSVLLWRTWILEAFFGQQSKEAFMRLLALSNDKKKPPKRGMDSAEPSQVFKAQQALVASCGQCIQREDYDSASYYVDCLMILSYLNSPESLEAALSVLNSNINLFPATCFAARRSRERLQQSFARLLYHHVSHHSQFRPSLVRSFLADSIEVFPENTIFLSLFAWHERRFRMDDRMRSVISKQLRPTATSSRKSHESFILLLFNIHIELGRAVTLGSNVWSIRNAFERAVGSDTARHSPSLWKWYYDFEVSRGNPQRASAVNYRSITCCPWNKEIFALLFRDSVNFEDASFYQLQERLQSMERRELRIHVTWDKLLAEKNKKLKSIGPTQV